MLDHQVRLQDLGNSMVIDKDAGLRRVKWMRLSGYFWLSGTIEPQRSGPRHFTYPENRGYIRPVVYRCVFVALYASINTIYSDSNALQSGKFNSLGHAYLH